MKAKERSPNTASRSLPVNVWDDTEFTQSRERN